VSNCTNSIKVWHNDKYCYKATIPNEWKILETEEILIEGKDFTEKEEFGLVKIFVVLNIKYYNIKKNYNYAIWGEVLLEVNVNKVDQYNCHI
jgi:hypothetical protein